MNVTAGVSGSHSWRHTSLGLSVRGGYSHYFARNAVDSTDVSMLLGVRHQLTRHVAFSWNNTVGIFNRDPGLVATISPAVPFDPNQSYVPTTDFFNNRTVYLASQLGLVIQRTNRLSFSFGGGIFDTYRSSAALYGVLGESAQADVQYRLTRRSTIGAAYFYEHYGFGRLINSTNAQGVSGTFALQLSRLWEFSGYAGFVRAEVKFVQNVPVDPTVAAIIGITQSTQVTYNVLWMPNISARLSRTFHNGVLYFSGGHSITPGNGLFLTSQSTSFRPDTTTRDCGAGVSE